MIWEYKRSVSDVRNASWIIYAREDRIWKECISVFIHRWYGWGCNTLEVDLRRTHLEGHFNGGKLTILVNFWSHAFNKVLYVNEWLKFRGLISPKLRVASEFNGKLQVKCDTTDYTLSRWGWAKVRFLCLPIIPLYVWERVRDAK